MHCDSCEKTITRALTKQGITVKNISHQTGKATINHSDDIQSARRRIANVLAEKGYALEKKGSRNETSSVATEQKQYAVEKKIITHGLLTLSILLLVQALLVFGVYSTLPQFSQNHVPIFFYLPIAIVVNVIALWHHYAYRRNVSCMTGMMIGMTIGMTTGFMIGGLVGLTNGMFAGSVVGTIAGMAAGIYGGRTCGMMGTMEGAMAGLMSGTMGAMLTVMMVIDHVLWFLPFLFAICIGILAGLMSVIVKEHEGNNSLVKPWGFLTVLSVSFALMMLISIVMVLAPKGLY